jgi:murein L,D-transpeptidase YafK
MGWYISESSHGVGIMKFLERCFLFLLPWLIFSLSFAAMAQSWPSNQRSRDARARVTPGLELELSQMGLKLGSPIFLRIFKQEKQLEVWVQSEAQFKLFKSFPICYFSGNLGPKQKEGDMQSPEGFYFVPLAMMKPDSTYHLSFNLGYPNRYDRYHGRTGSFLMVHGDCVSIGCYAMTNPVIEQVWTLATAAFAQGQPFFRVHIFPFKMTPENLEKHKESPWASYWKNLEVGYQKFETTRKPPNVEVRNGVYVFD